MTAPPPQNEGRESAGPPRMSGKACVAFAQLVCRVYVLEHEFEFRAFSSCLAAGKAIRLTGTALVRIQRTGDLAVGGTIAAGKLC